MTVTRGLPIAAAAAKTGLSIDTLRYYEKAGLLAPPARNSAGRRIYSQGEVDWLVFVTRLRSTGMPIRKIQEYGELRAGGNATAAARKAILEEHREVIRAQLGALQENLENIDYKISYYEDVVREHECAG